MIETKGPVGEEPPLPPVVLPAEWQMELARKVDAIATLLPVIANQQDELRARIERMEQVALGLVEAMRSMEAMLQRVAAMRGF